MSPLDDVITESSSLPKGYTTSTSFPGYPLVRLADDMAEDVSANDKIIIPIPPSPPIQLSSSPSSPPSIPMICENTCPIQSTFCQDGGPGATLTNCPYGTDCEDCGPRHYQPPAPPQVPHMDN